MQISRKFFLRESKILDFLGRYLYIGETFFKSGTCGKVFFFLRGQLRNWNEKKLNRSFNYEVVCRSTALLSESVAVCTGVRESSIRVIWEW